ncbi:3D domain-containing protein [Desulforhopalus vacuolatus]|uniref:3D domain-containing protein n=1 Tax=Desulforhopalus vacuolatus TaxID=40414 RepID=UPI00196246C9|nr:3D domain-containing protein [Desulforhopalus vacuolatus]MBM9521032.1 3D domain-containing protein [Desulforhopalus vacuolatus]
MKKLLLPLIFFLPFLLLSGGCAQKHINSIETTAYCGCGKCCDWERGSWRYLKLDFWNRYVSKGARKGRHYDGRTASGTFPREVEEGFFSLDSLHRPWMIPVRILLFPWKFLPHDGTIAADTRYFPFGTRMFVPGYGWGTVEDRGGAIKGPNRIDLYFSSHSDALDWGRRRVNVKVYPP